MAYAFNDDKSKYEMFVVLEDSISVPANSPDARDYNQSELTALGINDPADYMVVSVMENSGTSGGTPTYWATASDAFNIMLYPKGSSLGPAISVGISNKSANNLIYQYRVVLMKYPGAA